MGILNLTPDSFFDGGAYNTSKRALQQVEKMVQEGADFIDVGAFSSRPGAKQITAEEEEARLFPVAKELVTRFPSVLFSVDTFRSHIAKKCLDVGFAMVNDISGGEDPKMFATVAQYKVPYILMHMQGTPEDMQQNPKYQDVVRELIYFFSEKIRQAYDAGINDVIVDPGFGFGKSLDHNYELLRHLEFFKQLETPLLAGVSRKSMISKVLNISPEDSLNGTTVLHTLCLKKGAHILRVHDVKAAKECITLVEKVQNS